MVGRSRQITTILMPLGLLILIVIHERTVGSEQADAGVLINPDAAVTQQFAGHGSWQRGQNAASDTHAWHVHALKRADGSITAKLSVPGATELQGVTADFGATEN